MAKSLGLQAMVLLGRISARVWLPQFNSTTGSASADHPKDELNFIHYRVDRRCDGLLEDLNLPNETGPPASREASPSMHRLRLLPYLWAR